MIHTLFSNYIKYPSCNDSTLNWSETFYSLDTCLLKFNHHINTNSRHIYYLFNTIKPFKNHIGKVELCKLLRLDHRT